MKTVFLFLAFSLVLGGCTSSGDEHQHDTAQTAQEEYYTCPMHPSVRSDRPGACPVCGMALVKKTALQEATEDELAGLHHVSLSPTQRVLANVATRQAQTRSLVKEITSAGIVAVAEPLRATVSARFRGRLEQLHVAFTGETVRKGQRLFDLYSPDLISAEQEYLLALRSPSLFPTDPDLVSGSNRLLAAARERLILHFGMTDDQITLLETSGTISPSVTFHAPIAGTVITKEIREGQYVDEGTPLYEVADLARVWIYFDLYESEFRHVAAGQEVLFATDAHPGKTFTGTVTFIDPVMETETRTVRVRTEASNPKNILKPGMFVNGRIRVPLAPSVTVPATSVMSLGRNDVVWIETEPNAFVPRVVTVGVRTREYAQILSGVTEGETVVVSGGYLIDSESTLQSPGAADPHAGHSEQTSGGMADGRSGSGEEVPVVPIHVKGTYQPDRIHLRRGETVILEFHREEEAACTREVIFADFGIRRVLPAFQKTRIEFTPQKSGRFRFTCGMDMVHGTLIVE